MPYILYARGREIGVIQEREDAYKAWRSVDPFAAEQAWIQCKFRRLQHIEMVRHEIRFRQDQGSYTDLHAARLQREYTDALACDLLTILIDDFLTLKEVKMLP
jgi:hypothetical protein